MSSELSRHVCELTTKADDFCSGNILFGYGSVSRCIEARARGDRSCCWTRPPANVFGSQGPALRGSFAEGDT